MLKKITYSSATGALDDAYCPITMDWHVQLYNDKCMTCTILQLRLKSGLLMTNHIQIFWYSYDYDDNNKNNNNSNYNNSNNNNKSSAVKSQEPQGNSENNINNCIFCRMTFSFTVY